jgi:hypothetical protein
MANRSYSRQPAAPVRTDDVSLHLMAQALAHEEHQVLERLEKYLSPGRYDELCRLVLEVTEVPLEWAA